MDLCQGKSSYQRFSLVGGYLSARLLFFLLLFSPFLCGCHKKPPSISSVASSVIIIPGEVHAEAGSKIQLRAEVLDQRGLGMATSAEITWKGKDTEGQELVFTNFDGKTAVLTVPKPPNLDGDNPVVDLISVQAVAQVPGKRGSVKSTKATIHITFRELFGGTPPNLDRLDIPHTPGGPPSIILMDAKADGQCWWDRVLGVAGRAYFSESMEPGCEVAADHGNPGPEMAVFSRGATQFWDRANLTGPSWDASYSSTSPLWSGLVGEFRPPSSIPVSVDIQLWNGVRGPSGETDSRILSDLRWANEILEKSWAGINLRRVGSIKRLGDGAAVTYDPDKCEDAAYHSNLFGSGGPVDHKVIQVLYVDEIDWYGERFDILASGDTLASGKACPWYKYPTFPTLIVLEMKASSWGTLAHELGHLLGLNEEALKTEGHTDYLSSEDHFACWNVMWGNPGTECPGNRDRFSLGQVFRMHVHNSDAWLAHLSLQSGVTRCCQKEDEGTFSCPPLSTDIWRSRR